MRFSSPFQYPVGFFVLLAALAELFLLSPALEPCWGDGRGNYVVQASRAVKVAQIVGEFDREVGKPTQSQTMTRFKLYSTDLGASFRHRGRTYLLFGDTDGAEGGDAIAYVTESSPEAGIKLNFLHNENGVYRPVFIPGVLQGAYEVPMEGTSVAEKMYVYHTTGHRPSFLMGRSVVAVSEDDGMNFNYLYDLSDRHFINVSVVQVETGAWKGLPTAEGTDLLMFGSGHYRKSDVRLACQPADKIESPSSICYFAGLDSEGAPDWSCREEDAVALFDQPCVGELSVRYNRFIRKWIMLYNCGTERQLINMRTADYPWGPWSGPQVIFDPKTDGGFCRFMHLDWNIEKCDNLQDPGRDFHSGDPYGPYQFEDLATGDGNSTTIYFTMSTWNPYTVVLMKTTLTLVSRPD
ncbi:MAG: DUF4185 domain-containing protein [Desulfomonile tiedjei]|nr:DUF4185 domain-containing protein [Desulfomonile tiedjei]